MRHFRAGDGAELAFALNGADKPALLFVHGWQADGSVWRDIIGAMRPDLSSIAVDLRGSGASRGARGPYRLERFATDLAELVDSIGAAPLVVVGHSMGATVALRLAADAPEMVRGLVLIAPVPASGGGYSPKGEAFLRATAGDPPAARSWLARTLTDPADEATLGRLCAAAARTERDVALESFESWAHAAFAEATQRIEAPALVIAPQHDAPEAAQSRVAALLPNGRHVVLHGAAHYAIVERPNEIAQMIRDFLPSFDPRAARASG
jgi:pimeloyl-ACP methyl ester carboxylesterase